MMTHEQYLLIKIAEEAGEVSQRALKAAQFGLMEKQSPELEDNTERLIEELCDLYFYIRKLSDQSNYVKELLAMSVCHEKELYRETKHNKFLTYSQSLGMTEKN